MDGETCGEAVWPGLACLSVFVKESLELGCWMMSGERILRDKPDEGMDQTCRRLFSIASLCYRDGAPQHG